MDVAPFPRFQFHFMGLPVDWSWKLTTSGEHPDVRFAVKLAVCAKDRATQVISKTVSMAFLLNIVDLGPHGSFRKGVLRTKISRKNYS